MPSTDVMKRFYEVQVEKVRSQLALAMQTQRQLEKTLHDERAAWSDTLARMESELTTEKRRAEQASTAAASELQSAKKRLKLEKTHFASLQISDALAEQLSRQDESDLSIKEFVQLAVHRKVATLTRDLEAAHREVEELTRACAIHKATAAAASDEMEQTHRVADTTAMRLQHELELSAATRVELERQIAALCAQVDAFKDEQQQSGATAASRAQLESEIEALHTQLRDSESARSTLQTRYAELQSSRDELEQRVALLSADKQFLQDARAQLETHEAALLSRQRELLAKVETLQATHERDVDAHARAQSETRVAFERKLETEVAKFLETSARELERIRSSGQVVYERENRLLKDARDDALQQTQLLQTKLELTQSALEEKVLEATRMESGHSTALAGLRNDLKMKTFELSQLKLSLEEQLANCRAGRLEVEMLEHKVQVHREEFSKLEATSTARITQLEALLEVERSKLKEYEQLEVDLDDAVLQTGALLDGGSSNAGKSGEAAATTQLSEALTTFGAIPSSSKRRFQQSVALAQRVVKYQREALAWQQKLETATVERRELERELTRLRAQLAHVHQPQSYLLDKLKRQEHELQQTQRATEQTQQLVQALRSELARATDAKMTLQRQLQEVLARRGDLDALKASVQTLQQRLRAKAQSTPREQQQWTLSPQQRAHTDINTTKLHEVVGAMPVLHTAPSDDATKRDAMLGAEETAANKSTPSGSPFLKVSPPPSIASKMTQAPWPSPHTAASEHGVVDTSGAVDASSSAPDSSSDAATNADASGCAPSPPRWYTKLRS